MAKNYVVDALRHNKRVYIEEDSKNGCGGSLSEACLRMLQLGSSTELCRSLTIHGERRGYWVRGGQNATQRDTWRARSSDEPWHRENDTNAQRPGSHKDAE